MSAAAHSVSAVICRLWAKAAWLDQYGIAIEVQSLAIGSNDQLDALVSAAALSRLVIGGCDLEGAAPDARAEGGILLTPALVWRAPALG